MSIIICSSEKKNIHILKIHYWLMQWKETSIMILLQEQSAIKWSTNSNQKSFLSMLKYIRKLIKSYIKSNICIWNKITFLLAVIHFSARLQLQLLFYQVLSIESSSSSALWSQNLMLKSYYYFQKENLWISVRFRLLLKNWALKFSASKKFVRNSIYTFIASFNILILTSKTALIKTKKRSFFVLQKYMMIL